MLHGNTFNNDYPDSMIDILLWQNNSKILFLAGISMIPKPFKSMAKTSILKNLIKQAGSSRKVTENMVIQAIKMTMPEPLFSRYFDAMHPLKTHE